MQEDTAKDKLSAGKMILLHLVPGVINLVAIVVLLPGVANFGAVSVVAGYLMVLVSIVPVQLGILLYVAKKRTGTFHILKLIPFLEKGKATEYLLFVLVVGAWAVLTGFLLDPFETNLRDTVFAFFPDSIAVRNIDLSQFSKGSLLFTAIFGLIANGLIAPLTEELYFRGYLLPRINLSPNRAVLAHAVLFALYHFFSPWNFASRVLVMVPTYYWVMKRRNIRFSLIAHLLVNLYSNITILIMVLAL